MTDDRGESDDLQDRAAEGDAAALAALFERYRQRLRAMVRPRLDRRLQGWVDPSDVLQEAYLDLTQQFPAYAERRDAMPFFLWLRLLTGQRLMRIHRRHLGAAMRDAGRDVSLHWGAMPRASSESLAARLFGRVTTASQAAERRLRLQRALDRLSPIDREVIALRHFEELGNAEVAQVLGLSKTAAGNRHVRAMTRLQAILEQMSGLLDPSGD